jgi:hypothetical protein
MNNIQDWAKYFLHQAYNLSRDQLALYRICYAGFFLLFGLPTFSWISNNPDIFFNPPFYSLAAFLSGFPPFEILLLLDITIALLFIFLLFGYKTKIVSILITVLWITGNSFRYSFGKIDHDIIPILIPFLMAFSGWGNKFSIDSKQNDNIQSTTYRESGLPITLIALILGFGFFTAGFPKLLHWIDFDLTTQGVRSWVIRGYYEVGRDAFLLPFFAEINSSLFWELLDIVAVIFELGFFISVFKPSLFRTFVGIAVLFHFTNLLMLNISFYSHLIVYLLFINWSTVKNRTSNNYIKKSLTKRNLIITGIIYVGSLLSINYFFENISIVQFSPFNIILELFTGNAQLVSSFILLTAAVVFVGFSAYQKFFSSVNINYKKFLEDEA